MLSAGAVGVIVLGAAPMAAAQASPSADPILAQAIDGSSAPLDPRARLRADRPGRPAVSLAGLRGKAVLLTFLDPVCTTDCPLIGAGVPPGRGCSGPRPARSSWSRSNLNPLYRGLAYTRAFDRQESLTRRAATGCT